MERLALIIFTFLHLTCYSQNSTDTSKTHNKHYIELGIAGANEAGLIIAYRYEHSWNRVKIILGSGIGAGQNFHNTLRLNEYLRLGYNLNLKHSIEAGVGLLGKIDPTGGNSTKEARVEYFIKHYPGSVPFFPMFEETWNLELRYNYRINKFLIGVSANILYGYFYLEKKMSFPFAGINLSYQLK